MNTPLTRTEMLDVAELLTVASKDLTATANTLNARNPESSGVLKLRSAAGRATDYRERILGVQR